MRRFFFPAIIILAFHLIGIAYGQQVSSTEGVEADPTATILGVKTEVCLGDSVEAYLNFTGDGPWDVVINDNSGEYLKLKGVDTPYTIWLKPVVDDRYYIASIKDRKKHSGLTYGEVIVSVYESPTVSTQLDRTAYLQSEAGVKLAGTPPGGLFSGEGVAGDVFYPSIATAEGSPYRITYTYTNLHGCSGSDAINIYVLYGEGEVFLLSGNETVSSLCDDGETYVIKGSNLDNIPGVFELREAGSSVPVPGHISDENLLDDMARLDPTGLVGSYDLIYRYESRGLIVIIPFRFRVSDPGLLGMAGLPGDVCNNHEPYPLVPDLAEDDPGAIYEFSGPGVSGNQEEGYYYDPGDPDAPLGENQITLEYTSSHGCHSKLTQLVNNRFAPDVHFSLSPVCLPGDGGLVTFENLSSGIFEVESWRWDFGDPASEADNFSSLENPEHFYEEAGSYQISLTLTSSEGCEVVQTLDTVLTDQPVADFTWLNDCFVEDQKTGFLGRTISTFSSLDEIVWTFKTSKGVVLGVIEGSSSTDTVEFSFPGLDNYLVEYQVQNEVGCRGAVTKEITLKPVSLLPLAGYKEDFNGQKTDWFSGADGSDLSWIRAEPDFTGFDQVPGDWAWFTDLPSGNPGYFEYSWIQSNCFDFSSSRYPFITIDLMKSFRPDLDGAVLQYQDLVSEGWKTIGKMGEGNNWYNVMELVNKPGGSSVGWGMEGLDLFNPDTEWVNASHSLDMVTGNPHVKFRLAIATGGKQEVVSGRYNQGFAFDNIVIGERSRRSLLEYFTNSSSVECKEADNVVDLFAKNHFGSVVDLQYHMDYPGVDPMNLNNPYPPSTRSFKYGVQGVPSAILNGGTRTDHRFDFSDPFNEPNDEVLQEASLEIPVFDVDLDVSWLDNRLEASTLVTCKTDTFSSNLQLYVVVMEAFVTAYSGLNQDTMFRNVVLDILPTPAGKLLGNVWFDGKTDSRTYSWDYQEYVEDIEDLVVVAFIQDRDHGQVLQVASEYLTPQVGERSKYQEYRPMAIYPNPAADLLYVNLGNRNVKSGKLLFMDLSGKVVRTLDTQAGKSLYQLDVADFSMGMYMIYWIESGEVKGRDKLVITR